MHSLIGDAIKMEYKVVVSDPGTGKSYQVELKDEKAKKIKAMKIGDNLDGSILGLPGYSLEITGGSDKGGFPMKEGVHTQTPQKIYMGDGVGYNAEKGQRKRRRIHGEIIGDSIVQVNTKVVKAGTKGLDDLLGSKEEAQEDEGENKSE